MVGKILVQIILVVLAFLVLLWSWDRGYNAGWNTGMDEAIQVLEEKAREWEEKNGKL